MSNSFSDVDRTTTRVSGFACLVEKKTSKLMVQRSAKMRFSHPDDRHATVGRIQFVRDKKWSCKMRPSTPERLHIGPLLSSLGNDIKPAHFRRNQIIFSKGDRSDSIFYIQKGSVKLTLTSRQGKEAVIAVLAAGSFFGDSALASDRPPRPSHAVALMDVRAATIDPDAMVRLLHKDDDVCDAVISSLIALKTKVIGNFGDNLLYSSEERLARALLSIAKLYEDPELWPGPKLSQQDLANMIGITRQRVNFFLKRFKKSGFVDYGGGLRVHSSIVKVVGKD
jgi:CRP/FNR family cyclic AMP-dependent transcriptional regulator